MSLCMYVRRTQGCCMGHNSQTVTDQDRDRRRDRDRDIDIESERKRARPVRRTWQHCTCHSCSWHKSPTRRQTWPWLPPNGTWSWSRDTRRLPPRTRWPAAPEQGSESKYSSNFMICDKLKEMEEINTALLGATYDRKPQPWRSRQKSRRCAP